MSLPGNDFRTEGICCSLRAPDLWQYFSGIHVSWNSGWHLWEEILWRSPRHIKSWWHLSNFEHGELPSFEGQTQGDHYPGLPWWWVLMSVRTQGPEVLISLSVCVQYFSIPLSLLFSVKEKLPSCLVKVDILWHYKRDYSFYELYDWSVDFCSFFNWNITFNLKTLMLLELIWGLGETRVVKIVFEIYMCICIWIKVIDKSVNGWTDV